MKFQTASQSALPPPPDTLFVDPLVQERTKFSPDRRHRYTLFRHWGDPENFMAFIGMNPSGADESAPDRTVAKCERLARAWGFGAFYMLNAFALRATKPEELYQVDDPVGPDNDYWIGYVVTQAKLIVPAWGRPGGTLGRGAAVTEMLELLTGKEVPADRIRCFGRNQDGTPVHPLYQKESLRVADLQPFFA